MRDTARHWRGPLLFLAGLLLAGSPLASNLLARSDQGGVQAAPPAPRVINQPTDPALRGFRWREVGPTAQGGRIDDFAFESHASRNNGAVTFSMVWYPDGPLGRLKLN